MAFFRIYSMPANKLLSCQCRFRLRFFNNPRIFARAKFQRAFRAKLPIAVTTKREKETREEERKGGRERKRAKFNVYRKGRFVERGATRRADNATVE